MPGGQKSMGKCSGACVHVCEGVLCVRETEYTGQLVLW